MSARNDVIKATKNLHQDHNKREKETVKYRSVRQGEKKKKKVA